MLYLRNNKCYYLCVDIETKTLTIMKKLMLMLAATMAIFATGCDKNDNENETLTGTEWKSSENGVKTLVFSADKAALTEAGAVNYYTYTYNAPTVVLTPERSDYPELRGTVKHNMLTLTNTSTEQTVGIFTRQ